MYVCVVRRVGTSRRMRARLAREVNRSMHPTWELGWMAKDMVYLKKVNCITATVEGIVICYLDVMTSIFKPFQSIFMHCKEINA